MNLQLPDFGTLLLSMVLALIVWWVAVNQENPLLVQDLAQRVPVTILGMGEGLVMVEDLSDESVKLRLRAPRSTWEELNVSDFRASINLAGLAPGQHDVAVQVTGRDPQVTVLDIQRPLLHVTLDPLAVKEVPVQVEIMDGTAFGYDAQPPVFSPISVTISGPASLVQQVAAAHTEMFLRGAKNQVESVLPLTLVDGQEQTVVRVTAEPEQVQVVVPVEQWPGRKEVAVRMKLAGRPADGYRLSNVKVEPTTVVLQGEVDALAQVPGYVETEPFSLEGATSDVRKRVRLILPEGVLTYDGDNVVGTVGITPIEGSLTLSQPLVQQGLAPGLRADSALEDVDVVLSGPVPLLDSLSQDDLFVILDLTGLISGTHAVEPKVVLPDGIRTESVIPMTIEVVIGQASAAPGLPARTLPALPAPSTTVPITLAGGTIPPVRTPEAATTPSPTNMP